MTIMGVGACSKDRVSTYQGTIKLFLSNAFILNDILNMLFGKNIPFTPIKNLLPMYLNFSNGEMNLLQ